MNVLIAAGEVSGDAAGAWLARGLRTRADNIGLFGIGGQRMAEAGVDLKASTNHLGTVGVSEALAVLPSLWTAFKAIRTRVAHTPPDVAVLIGNDVFNVALARWFKMRGIPTVSFFPPQVWIWGALAPMITRSFDLMLTCFPTEQAVYGRSASPGTHVTFVGHYLAEQISPRTDGERLAIRQKRGIDDGPCIALLPGSRNHEVKNLTPVLLGAARRLLEYDSKIRFLVPLAEASLAPTVRSAIHDHGLTNSVECGGASLDAMRASDIVVTASGTASLEAALLGVPMVIVYKVSWVTNTIVESAIRVGLMKGNTAGLPNLLLEKPVVPEFKQGEATSEVVAGEVLSLLGDHDRKQKMVSDLGRISQCLQGGKGHAGVVDSILGIGRRRAEIRRG